MNDLMTASRSFLTVAAVGTSIMLVATQTGFARVQLNMPAFKDPPIVNSTDEVWPCDSKEPLTCVSTLLRKLLQAKPESTGKQRAEVVASLKGVGVVQASELAPIVVEFLDFHVSELGNAGLAFDSIPSVFDLYPAAFALNRLGKSSLPALQESLGEDRSSTFKSNAVYTIRNIIDHRNNIGTRIFLRVASEESETKVKRLRYLVDMLKQPGPFELRGLAETVERPAIEPVDVFRASVKNGKEAQVRDIFTECGQTRSYGAALFLAQYIDLRTVNGTEYFARAPLIEIGATATPAICRAIVESKRSKEFVQNGVEILMAIHGREGAIEALESAMVQMQKNVERYKGLYKQLPVTG